MGYLQTPWQTAAATTASLLAGFLLFGRRRASAGSAGTPQVSQMAPDFSLPSQDGTPVRLGDYRGKWVVLYFYPRDSTPGCTIEANHFQRDLPKFESNNAVVIGVSLDSAESHRNFCTRQGLTFKLLSDENRQVVSDYGSLKSVLGFKMAARNTFLIGPDGRIVQVWTDVNPAGHSEAVVAALDHFKTAK